MRAGISVCAVLALVACDSKKKHPFAGSSEPAPVEASGSAAGSGEAPATATGSSVTPAPSAGSAAAPVAPSPTPAPPPPAGDQPPLSADVLPSGEATPKTRAVIGDDFRFQIPDTFTKTTQDGGPAYTGTVDGFGSPAQLTFWATSEPFKGNLDALVARETKAVLAAKATDPGVGPVMIFVADDIKQNYAKRLTIKLPDRVELRTVVVHDGRAYIHHCATPNVSNAWANVGSDCITRGTTFHVKPPALKAIAKPTGPPPRATSNVVFLASKLEGKARPKSEVNPWLADIVAPRIKPCLVKLTGGPWNVSFEIAKDGTAGKASVDDGDALVAEASVIACVGKALEAKPLGKAAEPMKMTGIFIIN